MIIFFVIFLKCVSQKSTPIITAVPLIREIQSDSKIYENIYKYDWNVLLIFFLFI